MVTPYERPRTRSNDNVCKSGPLHISSKALGWKFWKKCWVLMTRTSILFFEDDPSQRGTEVNTTLGEIDLNNSGSVIVRSDKRLLTVLFPDGRTFTLKAETLEDAEEWKIALERALAAAPDAALVMDHDRNDSIDAVEPSTELGKDRRSVKSMAVGRPILLALEDIDGSPSFLEKALCFIERFGDKAEGILRQAADVDEVEQRIRDYEQGIAPDEDAHVVSEEEVVQANLSQAPASGSAPTPAPAPSSSSARGSAPSGTPSSPGGSAPANLSQAASCSAPIPAPAPSSSSPPGTAPSGTPPAPGLPAESPAPSSSSAPGLSSASGAPPVSSPPRAAAPVAPAAPAPAATPPSVPASSPPPGAATPAAPAAPASAASSPSSSGAGAGHIGNLFAARLVEKRFSLELSHAPSPQEMNNSIFLRVMKVSPSWTPQELRAAYQRVEGEIFCPICGETGHCKFFDLQNHQHVSQPRVRCIQTGKRRQLVQWEKPKKTTAFQPQKLPIFIRGLIDELWDSRSQKACGAMTGENPESSTSQGGQVASEVRQGLRAGVAWTRAQQQGVVRGPVQDQVSGAGAGGETMVQGCRRQQGQPVNRLRVDPMLVMQSMLAEFEKKVSEKLDLLAGEIREVRHMMEKGDSSKHSEGEIEQKG